MDDAVHASPCAGEVVPLMPARCLLARQWGVWIASCGLLLSQLAFAQRADPQLEALRSDALNDRQRAPDAPPGPLPAAHVAAVRRAERLGAALFSASNAADASASSQAVLRAQATVLGTALDRCEAVNYRSVVLSQPEAPDTHSVYLLGSAQSRGVMQLGRHFGATVSADGSTVLSTQASSQTCLGISLGEDSVAAFAVHLLSCTPTEFHVFLSRQHRVPLYVRTSVGSWKVDANSLSFMSSAPMLCLDRKAPDAENKWVAVPGRSADSFVVAFLYLDAQAGFTFDVLGTLTVDAEGQPGAMERSSAPFRQKVRLWTSPWLHVLSQPWLEQAGLPLTPEWLGIYADRSDAVQRKVNRARAYNAIGESAAALRATENAPAEASSRADFAFEQVYALNALRQFERAIELASSARKRHERDWPLCKELGFAYAHGGRPSDAIEMYQDCLAITPESRLEVRAEIAFNIARSHAGLGKTTLCRDWLAKAREWVPAESAQRAMLDRASANPGMCGG